MQVPDRGEQYEQESRVFYHDGGAKRLQYGLFTLQVLVSGQAVCQGINSLADDVACKYGMPIHVCGIVCEKGC